MMTNDDMPKMPWDMMQKAAHAACLIDEIGRKYRSAIEHPSTAWGASNHLYDARALCNKLRQELGELAEGIRANR